MQKALKISTKTPNFKSSEATDKQMKSSGRKNKSGKSSKSKFDSLPEYHEGRKGRRLSSDSNHRTGRRSSFESCASADAYLVGGKTSNNPHPLVEEFPPRDSQNSGFEVSHSSIDDMFGKRSTLLRRVSFSVVEVRQYERILGDHPSVSSGPSLAIGWNHFPDKTEEFDLSNYERYRAPTKDCYPLILSRAARERLLFELGYSGQEVVDSIRKINKIKHQRIQTMNNLQVSKMEEAVEDARTKLVKMFRRRSYS